MSFHRGGSIAELLDPIDLGVIVTILHECGVGTLLFPVLTSTQANFIQVHLPDAIASTRNAVMVFKRDARAMFFAKYPSVHKFLQEIEGDDKALVAYKSKLQPRFRAEYDELSPWRKLNELNVINAKGKKLAYYKGRFLQCHYQQSRVLVPGMHYNAHVQAMTVTAAPPTVAAMSIPHAPMDPLAPIVTTTTTTNLNASTSTALTDVTSNGEENGNGASENALPGGVQDPNANPDKKEIENAVKAKPIGPEDGAQTDSVSKPDCPDANQDDIITNEDKAVGRSEAAPRTGKTASDKKTPKIAKRKTESAGEASSKKLCV
ncbi:hypothetical protein ARMSODRAFT_978801 [Armillaria solidipes]|uniref:Uncharacterized protein n=1 Tax=Armillaria solidipes TaxID=1076256 RepID=A0A2H3BCT5_9AGAR|nr:hypothetical protein ARMSODRAFT_978801 [Armillaria solidipes]